MPQISVSSSTSSLMANPSKFVSKTGVRDFKRGFQRQHLSKAMNKVHDIERSQFRKRSLNVNRDRLTVDWEAEADSDYVNRGYGGVLVKRKDEKLRSNSLPKVETTTSKQLPTNETLSHNFIDLGESK